MDGREFLLEFRPRVRVNEFGYFGDVAKLVIRGVVRIPVIAFDGLDLPEFDENL